mmetsp:Transcript_19347/g.44987  ORF Transcript_19347/g.44987 Transcript_19347/m.44987 type:complete len:840 (-) Transcript_19347:48-2567(-)
MPAVSMEQVCQAMSKTDNIRSISVIAHVDHGKTTLTDSLVCKAGIICAERAGDTCFMMGRADERASGITIKSTGVTLHFEFDADDGRGAQPYLVNLVDSPGHVDFSSEVTAALRITDGALVVVDSIEGCAVQTETVLRQAIAERVRPILFVNKVDRCILELEMEAEDMYLRFRNAIENVNVTIATYKDKAMGGMLLSPEQGNVGFGSGLHGWGFTVDDFARMYSSKMGVQRATLRERLWGDNFLSVEGKKKSWTTTAQAEGSEDSLPRGFSQLVVQPVIQLIRAIMQDDEEKYLKMFSSLQIVLTAADLKLRKKPLMKRAMQQWLSAGDALLSMIISKLPSPRMAQRYRVENLYSGPMDDEAAAAIRDCSSDGPLMMYVSKMVPTSDKGRFYAFGRVFSGTVTTGQKVRIQGAHYAPGTKDDLHMKSVQRTLVMMGRSVESVSSVPCGNTVALLGMDQVLLKSGTITTLESAHNFTDMKYAVSPVVKVAVKPKDTKDLPKLVEGLKRLSQSDQLVVCTTEGSGEHVIAGCGELHVQVCLRDLQEDFAQCELLTSDPIVTYKETVAGTSSQTCLAKSANKLNRVFMVAEPLGEELTKSIEDGATGPRADLRERVKVLRDDFGWTDSAARKIWCFGPDMLGANVIVDQTQEVPYLSEAKDLVDNAFQWTSKQGPLCEESMRGIRFNIMDMVLHSDKAHRGGGQLLPATRRCCFAATLTAQPTLQEPVFLVEITCPSDVMSGVYACITHRRGYVFEENPREGTPLVNAKAYLPVAESFGFVEALRQSTSGKAFPQCSFDHWDSLPGDAMDPGSKLQDKVLEIRKRKSLKLEMPKLSDYLDRL